MLHFSHPLRLTVARAAFTCACAALLLLLSAGPVAAQKQQKPLARSIPVSVEVLLSDNLVAPDESITVTAIARDREGEAINDPTLEYDIRIVQRGIVTGNPPMVEGNIIHFPKVSKRLVNPNPAIDPNGEYVDADPTDPNYGIETGGAYVITAKLRRSFISGRAIVFVLPTGTAKITVRTKRYGDQLVAALSAMTQALGAADPQAIESARAQLQAIAADSDNSYDVLKVNQVVSPPNGFLVTPAQLIGAGFQATADDGPYSTILDTLQNQISQVRLCINQINPAQITQADIDALQSALDTYRTTSQTLATLHPSTLGVIQHSEKLNRVVSSEITKLLDTITQKAIDIAANIPALSKTTRRQKPTDIVGFFFTTFGMLTNASGFATGNIIELSITAGNSIGARLINRRSNGELVLEWVQASSSGTYTCPLYQNTFVGGQGFSTEPGNMLVVLMGCVDSQLIRNLMTFNPRADIAAAIRLIGSIRSIAASLGRDQGITADAIPDYVITDYLFECQIYFNNGWPRVNQGRLPCVGTIILFNLETGSFAATNSIFLPHCG
jgi:hypothetical protein